MYDYIEACDTESTVELLKSSVVTFVNWNSKDSGKDVSNLFESDLSNRIEETDVTCKSCDSDGTDCKTVHSNHNPAKQDV